MDGTGWGEKEKNDGEKNKSNKKNCIFAMEEEEKKEAIEKTGVDYDKLKEIISTVYPVRYERRTAVAPVLWICGAMFTSSLIWCTVNMVLTDCGCYKTTVMWFALSVAGLSFAAAIWTVLWVLFKYKNVKDKEYEPRWDLLRSEHFLLEMRKMDIQIDGGNYGKHYDETGDVAPSNTVDDGTKKEN